MNEIKINENELLKSYNNISDTIKLAYQGDNLSDLSIRVLKLYIYDLIDPQTRINDIYEIQTQNALLEEENSRIEEVINRNRKLLKNYFSKVKDLEKNNSCYFDENKILNFLKNIKGGAYGGGKNLVTNVIDDILSYSEKDSYKCNVFLNPINAQPLRFDKSGMTYICARPSAGKTSALLNIAIDGLQQNKKVAFFTAEEPTKQLTIKLIKNLFYYECSRNNRKSLLSSPIIGGDTQEYFEKRIKYLFSSLDFEQKKKDIKNIVMGVRADDQTLIDYELLNAIDKINDYAKSELLQIIEVGKLESFEELLKEIAYQEEGTICLIDYIQRLPKPVSSQNYNAEYSQLKAITNQITQTIRDYKLIGISGAQMGRDSDKGKNSHVLEMSYIRECGDIENDATLAIGIGKNKTTQERFYNVMKARNFQYNETKTVLLNTDMKYSYFRTKTTLKENGYQELNYYEEKPKENKEDSNSSEW